MHINISVNVPVLASWQIFHCIPFEKMFWDQSKSFSCALLTFLLGLFSVVINTSTVLIALIGLLQCWWEHFVFPYSSNPCTQLILLQISKHGFQRPSIIRIWLNNVYILFLSTCSGCPVTYVVKLWLLICIWHTWIKLLYKRCAMQTGLPWFSLAKTNNGQSKLSGRTCVFKCTVLLMSIGTPATVD